MKSPHTLTKYCCLLAGVALVAPLHAADKELKSVAVTVGDLGNPFFVQIARGAEAKAKETNPNVKFTSLSSNYDVNNQTNQMDNLVSSGVNLILLNAADSKGIAPAVKRAKAAGSAVIAVDVGAEGGVDATVTSNNRQAGQQAAQYIVDKLKGKGNVFLGSEERKFGFLTDTPAMIEHTQQVLDRLGARFKAAQRAAHLSIAEQQQVEIARALFYKSRILVMDEPTTALSDRETDRLFDIVSNCALGSGDHLHQPSNG